MPLTKSMLERYDRQIRLFGAEAQERLRDSTVLVAGVGGLGCASSLYLTAAGVGRLILVDFGRVELSNLNRQILYGTEDLGRLKVEAASERLRRLNPEVEVVGMNVRISRDNVSRLVGMADLVVDGMDNWGTRYLLNDECVRQRKPFIHAGVFGMGGQLLVVLPGKGPCLRCVLPSPPAEEGVFPVLGVAPGILGVLQATEALKLITGYGEPSVGRMVVYDGYSMELRAVEVERRGDCEACGEL